MKAITFEVLLEEPLLVPMLFGEANSATSYPYLPGSQIRGALIGQCMRRLNLSAGDVLSNDEAKAFFDGRVRCLNAYPMDNQGQRMLPLPASWLAEKRSSSTAIDDLANLPIPSEDKHENGSAQKKGVPSFPFCSLDKDKLATVYDPQRQINVHTMRDPKKGRAHSRYGEVFRYEALDSGLRLQGVILLDVSEAAATQALEKQLIEDLNQTYWFGGSRSAGYGKALIHAASVHDASVVDGTAISSCDALSQPDTFTLTLLSDAILRDKATGQYTNELLTTLAESLGVEARQLHIEKRFWKTRLVGGFNRRWGLPLDQAVAVAAGSVFVIQSQADIAKEQFQTLLNRGIGDRCVDGFGRLAINWHTSENYHYAILTPAPAERTASHTEESLAVLQAAVDTIYRQRLDHWLMGAVQTARFTQGPLRNHQVAQLRLSIRSGMTKPLQKEPLASQLEAMLSRNTARAQLSSAKLDDKALDAWINAWVKDPTRWFEQQTSTLEDLTVGDCKPSHFPEELSIEYGLRFLDGVLHRATSKSMKAKNKGAQDD